MTVVSLIACAVIAWAVATRSGSLLRAYFAALLPSKTIARCAAFALIPLYWAQLACLWAQIRSQEAFAGYAWLARLPIPVFDDRLPGRSSLFDTGVAIGILETVALSIVVLCLRRRTDVLGSATVVTLAAVLAAFSILWPAMSTTDPYEYVATGLLGFAAYSPPIGALEATVYQPYQHLIALLGVIYGPLWVVVDTLQTSLGSSMYQKLEAIRVTNAGFVVCLLWLLARAGLPRSAIVAFAINPMLWFYAVANPHADIEGLVLLTAAYGFARRSKIVSAVTFLTLAGLIKLPFVLLGGAILASLGGVTRRLGLWASAIVLVVIISYLVPGPAYMRGLAHFAAREVSVDSYRGWFGVVALLVAATIGVVAFGRGLCGAAWLFQQLPLLAFPWYLFWGVPYALVTGGIEIYAVTLPLGASLMEETSNDFVVVGVFVAFLLALATDAYLSTRSRTLRHRDALKQ